MYEIINFITQNYQFIDAKLAIFVAKITNLKNILGLTSSFGDNFLVQS